MRGRHATGAVSLVFTLLLAGCGVLGVDEVPDSFVGQWASTDGKSFLQLDADLSGSFTMCEPDDYDGNLRYNFDSKAWPATVPLEWERADPAGSNRLYLYQDWDLRESTGTGFRTVDVSLDWRDGALEMGADLVVRFVPADGDQATCSS